MRRCPRVRMQPHSLTHAFIARAAATKSFFSRGGAALFVTNQSVAVAAAVSSADRGVGCSALPSRLPARCAATWLSTCGICTCLSARPSVHARTPSAIHSSFLIKFGTKAAVHCTRQQPGLPSLLLPSLPL